MAEVSTVKSAAGRAWLLLVLRLGLVLVTTVGTWLILRAVGGIQAFPPNMMWATLGLLPVNLLCLALVRKFSRDDGVSLREALGIQKQRIGRDVL